MCSEVISYHLVGGKSQLKSTFFMVYRPWKVVNSVCKSMEQLSGEQHLHLALTVIALINGGAILQIVW